MRMLHFSHCFVNIWKVEVDGGDKVYVGTIDVDESGSKRDGDKIVFDTKENLENVQWKHHNGFMAKVVRTVELKQTSKL